MEKPLHIQLLKYFFSSIEDLRQFNSFSMIFSKEEQIDWLQINNKKGSQFNKNIIHNLLLKFNPTMYFEN